MNEKERARLKDVEVRLISELMKNSRRSDRELAHAIGTSQPTVSRAIKRLEEESVIEEYTIIPNFKRLGYQIMGVSFYGRGEPSKKEEKEESPYQLSTHHRNRARLRTTASLIRNSSGYNGRGRNAKDRGAIRNLRRVLRPMPKRQWKS